jgi:ATPase family associated with various cellular activities (AAA)
VNRREWEQANTEYLACALAWLRLRLEAYAQQHPRDAEAGPEQGPQPTPGPEPILAPLPVQSWPRRPRFSGKPLPAEPPIAEPATAPLDASPPPRITGEQVEAAALAATVAEEHDPPPALVSLGHLLGLTRFERDTLLLCVGAALDSSVRTLCAQVLGDPYPTFALALAVLPDPAWDVLSPPRPLRRWRLVEIGRVAGQPLLSSPLQADERIVDHIKGLDYLDDRIEPLVTPLVADPEGLPPSQRAMADDVVRAWRNGEKPVVALLGADGRAKRQVAAEAARQLGITAVTLSADLLPRHAQDLETLAQIWQRESLLLPLVLHLDADEARPAPDESGGPPVARFVHRVGSGLLLASREPWPGLNGATVSVDVAPPTPDERRDTWLEMIDPDELDQDEFGRGRSDAKAVAESLAGQFVLDAPAIRSIARQAAVQDGPPGLADRLWRDCLAFVRPRLDALAQRLTSAVSWDDIVLPAEELTALHEIADQVAHRHTVYYRWGFADRISRGLGISALFSGPSGTGKSMAAEVIANHLRLDLHRIDLSTVVDKYIGETEKNLRRLFDAAESGGAILFFDEADALFGKRSEVKDSHDRYANIEVNYLLQRMESFTGLAVLATNMRSALDPAFLRRLRFVVTFPYPGVTQRREIWARVLPSATPRDSRLDLDRLAHLPVTGGMIRNIAMNAAFAAAAAGTDVTMPLLLAASRNEFRKADLPMQDRDFSWSAPEVARL